MGQPINILGDLVREVRKGRHMSQEELAAKIGVSTRTIIGIENKTVNPKLETLCLLVRELELPLDQLFYPELPERLKLKGQLIGEINDCSEKEIKFILEVVKSMRGVWENKEEHSLSDDLL